MFISVVNVCFDTEISFFNSYYTKQLRIKTPMRPTMDTVVSISVQDFKVSFMLRLKYSLNSQNPPSFTCESMILPAPVASTNNSGDTEVFGIIGAMILPAVNPATVADPTLILIMAAINHANKIGDMPNPLSTVPS